MMKAARFLFAVIVTVIVTGAFAATLTACSFLAERVIEKPKVELVEVGLTDVGVQWATVLFGVEVENPNPFVLRLDSLKYDAEIGQQKFGEGYLDKRIDIPAHQKSIVQIPVKVDYAQVFTSMLDFLKSGQTSYRVKGEAVFALMHIPFDKSGNLELKQ